MFCRIGSTPALTGLVSPVGFMGAPGIMIEKLERGTEYTDAVECQRQVLQAGYMDQIPDKIGDKSLPLFFHLIVFFLYG